MRYIAASIVSVIIAALVIASDEFRPMPLNIAGYAVILLAWALALRWRIVAGASIGLLAWAVTPALHVPDLGRAVLFIIAGAIVGFALSEETSRKTEAEGKQ
jgi:hypothetical protein